LERIVMFSDIIIRTCGERTTEACVARWRRILPAATLHVVELCPFSAALSEVYRIGAKAKGDWFVTCDADVLPYMPARTSGTVWRQYLAVCDADVTTLMVNDWLWGRARQGGVRVYRKGVAEKVAEHVRDCPRPESTACREAGVTHALLPVVAGMHDEHQWYRDVWRKAAHHMAKQPKQVQRDMIPRWQGTDLPDFRVALAAIEHAPDFAALDANTFPDVDLAAMGLTEKEPFTEDVE
jgi:hypothetical protein